MDDDEDFLSAMSDVAPLDGRRRRKAEHQETQREAKKALPKALTLAQLERRYAALGLHPSRHVDENPLTLGEVPVLAPRDMVGWKKDGVQHQVFSRLRQGGYPVEGSLDLHRLSVKEAREAVFKFFRLAVARRWRTVLVAHGRGEQSATPARLKSYVVHWLTQLPEVIAYASAERHQGGTGATLVLLRKSAVAREETRERFGQKSDPG